MDNDETLLRRARLRELIDVAFKGKLVDLAAHMESLTNSKVNQAELSSLRKDNGPKAFGDKKARTLTEQIGLHRQWFSMPLGTALERREWKTLSGFESASPTVELARRMQLASPETLKLIELALMPEADIEETALSPSLKNLIGFVKQQIREEISNAGRN